MPDPSDLVSRLRSRAATLSANGAKDTAALLSEAAEALERAEYEILRLTNALDGYMDSVTPEQRD